MIENTFFKCCTTLIPAWMKPFFWLLYCKTIFRLLCFWFQDRKCLMFFISVSVPSHPWIPSVNQLVCTQNSKCVFRSFYSSVMQRGNEEPTPRKVSVWCLLLFCITKRTKIQSTNTQNNHGTKEDYYDDLSIFRWNSTLCSNTQGILVNAVFLVKTIHHTLLILRQPKCVIPSQTKIFLQDFFVNVYAYRAKSQSAVEWLTLYRCTVWLI